MKPIIVALLASLLFLAACGDSGRETATPTPPSDTPAATPAAQTPTEEPAQETPTATEPSGGAGGGGLEGTPVVALTPFPSPSPVPADWQTYSDPCGHFSFSYPQGWFLQASTADCNQVSVIASTFEPGTVGARFPEGSIKVDVFAFSTNIVSQCEPGADAPAVLSGVPARQVVTDFDPARSDGLTRSHAIAAIHDGFCFGIGANFAQDSPDESTFLQIVDSFKLAK